MRYSPPSYSVTLLFTEDYNNTPNGSITPTISHVRHSSPESIGGNRYANILVTFFGTNLANSNSRCKIDWFLPGTQKGKMRKKATTVVAMRLAGNGLACGRLHVNLERFSDAKSESNKVNH